MWKQRHRHFERMFDVYFLGGSSLILASRDSIGVVLYCLDLDISHTGCNHNQHSHRLQMPCH